MPSIETFMTFLLALTLLEISPGPDMMLTIATWSGRSDERQKSAFRSQRIFTCVSSSAPPLKLPFTAD